jgi:hypothetical protein
MDNRLMDSGQLVKGQNVLDISKLGVGVYFIQSSNYAGHSNQNVRFIVAR